MRVCVDLCSGLGGFSEAFVKDGWKVIRVDNNPKFKDVPFTVILDVTTVDWEWFKQTYLNEENPDVLLASPPCERFSIACHTFPKKGIQKAMEIVGACFEAIAILKPKHWLIENPMGRLRWFLGKPPMTIRLCDYGAPYKKLTDLWGNISLPLLQYERKHTAYVCVESKMNAKHPLKVATHNRQLKAKIPLGVSEAVLKGVKNSFEVKTE